MNGLIVTLAIVAGAVLFLVTILLLDARARGWRRLAGKFRTGGPPGAAALVRQDANVGSAGILQLRGLFRAAVTDDGLYFAAPAALWRTHPPLLIPWDQLALRHDRTRLGMRIVRLSVGRVHLGFLTLRGGVAQDVWDRLGGEGSPL
jgi:hypothetical protein